jgi:hypothetical protein
MRPNDEFQTTLDDNVSLEPLLGKIKRQHGPALLAILVYGSWLRGKRDTMLDFYVLVEDYRTLSSAWQGWVCRLIPPNVYHIHHGDLRAKYAMLTLDRFCHSMQHDFHSYFWARFAQPCDVLYARDPTVQSSLINAFKMASVTFAQHVVPSLHDQFTSRELWTSGLSQTYRCELRTESSHRAESLYEFNPDWYDEISRSLAGDLKCMSTTPQSGVFNNQSGKWARKSASTRWWLRRLQGRLLSVLRLGKAAFTFNDPLQYLLWKVERHTGIYIEPSERQLKHPLIFAWPLLWKLYRRGAFR